jgi:S1-C subfamily serine protease
MYRNLVALAAPSVVLIRCHDLNSKGTGFLVVGGGYIITNNHVVAELQFQGGVPTLQYSTNIVVTIAGNEYPATLVSDPGHLNPFIFDYAILQVPNLPNASFLELADLSDVERGDDVVCLGYPLDFDDLIATNGIVSAIVHRLSDVDGASSMTTVVSNTLIQFGNSGGPMIHVRSGKVIGINTHKHPLSDMLVRRLGALLPPLSGASPPSQSTVPTLSPGVEDLIRYALKYTYIGFNHAVSLEHVRSDSRWP